MIRMKTVFVIGAGASCEFEFPSGVELLRRVAETLNIRSDYSGDPAIMNALARHRGKFAPPFGMSDFLQAGRRLSASAKIARSVDNAIDQNDLDPLVPFVGKIAIAREILKSEAASPLMTRTSEFNRPDPESLESTWLYEFGQMLTTDVKASVAERAFENVSIITFNYDRVLEYALPTIISTAYGLSHEQSRDVASLCPIWHPFGSLGPLPHPGRRGVAFGGEAPLESIALDIFTFGERLEASQSMSEWQQALIEAKQVVFLGFGFHRRNLDLLLPPQGVGYTRVFATVFGETYPAVKSIKSNLEAMFEIPDEADFQVYCELGRSKCQEFLRDYYVTLTE